MLFGKKRIADNYMQIWYADSEGMLDIFADKNLTVEYTHFEKIEGIENYKTFLKSFYHSFPDLKVDVAEIFLNKKDDSATVFWNYSGTHQNDKIFGVEPADKKIVVNAMSYLKFKNKKVIYEKGIVDNLSLLMQLNPNQ